MTEIPRPIITQIQETDWQAYTHAYGDATDIPAYLMDLFSGDPQRVMPAIRDLDSRLCHQHVTIQSALEPALPILLATLAVLEDDALGLILELFVGIADVTSPSDPVRPIRHLDLTRTTIRPPRQPDTNRLFQQVRHILQSSRLVFEGLLRHPNTHVFEMAVSIVGTLTAPPDHTAAALSDVLHHESVAWRRAWIASAFQGLTGPLRSAVLMAHFGEEEDPLVRLVVAALLAHDPGVDCPAVVIDELSMAVLGDRTPVLRDPYTRVPWSNGFYEDVGIGLALRRPAVYAAILERYVRFAEAHDRYIIDEDAATMLLAFTFCWDPPARARHHMTPLQHRVLNRLMGRNQELRFGAQTAWVIGRFGGLQDLLG